MSIPMFALACGPYFDEDGLTVSLVLLLGLKPLTYFAFIQAFRYRVSRPIPMRFRRAIGLTLARAGLGFALVGFGALATTFLGRELLLQVSWLYLYGSRLFAWWLVGRFGAGLRDRRLVGWVISGTMINIAFDVALVAGFIAGWVPSTIIVAVVAAFIAVLHVVGRRQSLRRRFGNWSNCHSCGYDLTGNLSGACPECGTSIGLPGAARQAA